MPLAPRAHRGLHGLAHGAAELHAAGELLGHALGDQLGVDLGVLDLEDVQLDLLAGELLELAADAVGLGATATDDDAGARGVDVHADAVTGALDLDLGDAGPLHALGQQLADGDVLTDVALVELVGVPPALVVGGDAQAEAVRVDLLAHQAFRPFLAVALLGRRAHGRRLHDEGDVAGALVDARRAALGTGTPALHRGALVDHGDRDDQVAAVEVLGGLGVGDGALEHLVDGLGGRLRRELQQGQGLVDGQTADHVDDTAGLHRRDPHVACAREGTRLVAEQRLAAGAACACAR